MNLPRINELNNLLRSLRQTLKNLKNQASQLSLEAAKSQTAQQKLDAAVQTAKRRAARLADLGVSTRFLEDITQPLTRRPDISGLSTLLKKKQRKTEEQIRDTNTRIWKADQEKKQLEMEVP